jgi:hypothetical protein
MTILNGIHIEVVWSDDYATELGIRCTNGSFAGACKVYIAKQSLLDFAGILSGFPSSPDDTRDFVLGTFDPHFAGGGARFHFFCADVLGQPQVDVLLRTEDGQVIGEPGSAAFSIRGKAVNSRMAHAPS